MSQLKRVNEEGVPVIQKTVFGSGKYRDLEKNKKDKERRKFRYRTEEKLREVYALKKMNSNRELREYLNISKNRLSSLMYSGHPLSEEESALVDEVLNEHGLEIKERVISFD